MKARIVIFHVATGCEVACKFTITHTEGIWGFPRTHYKTTIVIYGDAVITSDAIGSRCLCKPSPSCVIITLKPSVTIIIHITTRYSEITTIHVKFVRWTHRSDADVPRKVVLTLTSYTKYITTAHTWSTGIHGGSGGQYKIANGGDLSTNTRVTIDTAGQVGIGTASPENSLHIFKSENEQTSGLFIEKQNVGTGTAQITFGVNGSSENVGVAKAGIFFQRASLNGRGDLKFCVDNANDANNVGVSDAAMTIYRDGNVGIGTVTPYAPLHVNGASGTISSASRSYFRYASTGLTTNTNGWTNMSIYASTSIVCGNFLVSHSGTIGASDTRIKKNIVDADDAECLEILRLLKPKKYQYKDEIERGTEPVWGFIAQEVRETLPYATQLRKDVLPNIYELANVSSSNVITFVNFNTSNLESNATTLIRTKGIDGEDHDVHLAEVIDEHSIRVEEDLGAWTGSVDETGNVITEITTTTLTPEEYETLENKSGYVANITGYQNANVVISVDEYNALEDTTGYEEVVQDYTKTTTSYPGTQLFVYGQEVDDFVYLKKEAIWTVATSALQEVDRQLQAEKARNDALEARIAALENA